MPTLDEPKTFVLSVGPLHVRLAVLYKGVFCLRDFSLTNNTFVGQETFYTGHNGEAENLRQALDLFLNSEKL
jgi:hypothetical protein